MIGRETDTMDAAIADGNGLIARVRSESAAIRAELAAAPDVATPLAELRVSPELRERYATLQRVAAAADGLDRPWARLETGGAAAGLLAAQLAEHDRLVGVAAEQGRQAKYKEAIATIDSAAAILKAAHGSRDRLANTVDVSTLDQWLERNESYDQALRALYKLTPNVGKRVTKELKAAIAAEKAARARLPANSRGLVVIMSDIGQGWMNGGVIAIEEAKKTIADALEPPASRVARPDHAVGTLPPLSPPPSHDRCTATDPPPEDPRPVDVRVVTDQPWEVAADVLVIPIVGDPAFEGPLGELDRRTGGELRALAAFGELSGKRYADLAGGDRRAAGEPARDRRRRRPRRARPRDRASASARPPSGGSAAARSTGWRSGSTPARRRVAARRPRPSPSSSPAASSRARTTPRPSTARRVETAPPELDELILVAPGADAAALTAAAERGVIIGEGANMARTLSNRAANDVSPEVLADEARAIAEEHGLWIDVIEPERATELGMGMFMAVGRGSDNPPRMIVMRSGGEGEKDALDRHLAIVGKGVCFDSGGISIKPADRMEEMKMDKTGACTVIAAIATVAAAGARHAAAGRRAGRREHARPALDAARRRREGAQRQDGRHHQHRRRGPADPRRRDDLRRAARRDPHRRRRDADRRRGAGARATWSPARSARRRRATTTSWPRPDRAGERYWQLPLIDDYVPEMESWYGDLQNSGSAEGSLVKSGLFLREFVTVPWVHLDIAGTGYFRKAAAVRAARRDRRDARDARRAGAGRGRGRLTTPDRVGRPRRAARWSR